MNHSSLASYEKHVGSSKEPNDLKAQNDGNKPYPNRPRGHWQYGRRLRMKGVT